jgi:hypothetical protein
MRSMSLPDERDPVGDEKADVRRREEMLDEALESTFPASDPVSLSDVG